ncbi:SET domain-containing protein [Podospora aff. communis PSN243]|uniref:SET domain-containing protein n=1 Tax=Podospora aff. communis PSN243 TaxID=3040156 RepID=A0AAV9G1Q4_9PEZI|nr:SET domain-containing protein [Podospora aff. communis PSN243]
MGRSRVTTTTFLAAAIISHHLAWAGSQQKPIGWDGCLPGPVSDGAHPSCVTASTSSTPAAQKTPEPDAGTFDPKKYQPWTHQPYCPEEGTPFCVHTSTRFRDHGISYIAVPEKKAAELGEKTASSSVAAEKKDAPYEVRDLPGKGKGVVATKRIQRGTVLMVEHAAVIGDTLFPSRVKRAVGRHMLQRAMARLGSKGEGAILELARSSRDPEGVPAAEDLMKTNSFTVKIGGKSHMALFPRVSRINHACKPSAITRFDEQSLSMTIRAVRNIEPGEEITLSYTDFGLSFHERQQQLKAKWGFDCDCSICSLPPAEIAKSDARREKIVAMGKTVIKYVGEQDWKLAIKTHREMIEVIEDEGLAPHMGDYYEVMTRLLAANKDMKNARKYARLALEEFEVAGEPNEELEQFLKGAQQETA